MSSVAEMVKSAQVAQVSAKKGKERLSGLIFKTVQTCDVNFKSNQRTLFIIYNAWDFSNCLILKVDVLSTLINFFFNSFDALCRCSKLLEGCPWNWCFGTTLGTSQISTKKNLPCMKFHSAANGVIMSCGIVIYCLSSLQLLKCWPSARNEKALAPLAAD